MFKHMKIEEEIRRLAADLENEGGACLFILRDSDGRHLSGMSENHGMLVAMLTSAAYALPEFMQALSCAAMSLGIVGAEDELDEPPF